MRILARVYRLAVVIMQIELDRQRADRSSSTWYNRNSIVWSGLEADALLSEPIMTEEDRRVFARMAGGVKTEAFGSLGRIVIVISACIVQRVFSFYMALHF